MVARRDCPSAVRIRGRVVTSKIVSRVAGFAACAVLVSLSHGSAEAAKGPEQARKGAPAAYASTKAPTAVNDPATTSSITAPPVNDASCQKSRKRLWVEGEGWLVRRVTTCF
jgi:hypothetical protein